MIFSFYNTTGLVGVLFFFYFFTFFKIIFLGTYLFYGTLTIECLRNFCFLNILKAKQQSAQQCC